MKFFLLVICLGLPAISLAQSLDQDTVQTVLSKHHLTYDQIKKTKQFRVLPQYQQEAIQESSYCFRDEAGEIHGNHVDELRNIASISKLFTTRLALDYYGVDHKFVSRFHVIKTEASLANGKKTHRTYLYIEGGLDPTFDSANLLALTRSLRTKGPFHQIMFDPKFVAYLRMAHDNPQTQDYTSETKQSLWSYFKKPAQQTTQTIDEFILEKQTEGLQISSHDIFVRESKPLRKILKAMNVTSHNFVANLLYDSIPNPNEILEKYGFSEADVQLHNGSGYPIDPERPTSRKENQASCESVLKVLGSNSECLENECIDLKDVFQETCDGGTLCNRFANNRVLKQNIVAKTGATNSVVGLAGWLGTQKKIPFVFLISTLNNENQHINAKNSIDILVGNLFATTQLEATQKPLPFSKKSAEKFTLYKTPSLVDSDYR